VIENIDEPVLPSNEEEEKEKESFFENKMDEDERPPIVPSIQDLDDKPVLTRLKFNDFDSVMDDEGQVSDISAPKNIERLEEISTERAIQRKLEEDEELDDAIKIHTDTIPLEGLVDLDNPGELDNEFVSLDDIEELN
jgi:cell division GTPase FtsZ